MKVVGDSPTLTRVLDHASGADRFEGIDWFPDEASGSPVVSSAIAYMRCKVVSRLETPDHW